MTPRACGADARACATLAAGMPAGADRRRRAAGRGRHARAGSAPRPTCPRALPRRRRARPRRRARHARARSTATRTSSTAATARASSSCACRARATRTSRAPAAASARPSRRRAPRARTRCSHWRRARLRALQADGVTTVEIKSGYGLTRERRGALPARRAPARRASCRVDGAHAPASPRTRCRRNSRAAPTPTSTPSAHWLPALHAEGLVDAVDALLRAHRLHAGADASACSRPRARLGLPVKLHAEQLSDQGGAQLAARFGALSCDHLEYAERGRWRAMARGRHGGGAAARRLLLPARDAAAAGRGAARAPACRSPIATDHNPGTVAGARRCR